MTASVLVPVWLLAALPLVGAGIVWATVRFTIDVHITVDHDDQADR